MVNFKAAASGFAPVTVMLQLPTYSTPMLALLRVLAMTTIPSSPMGLLLILKSFRVWLILIISLIRTYCTCSDDNSRQR